MSNLNQRLVVTCALIALAMSAQGCAEEEAIAAASVGSACSPATPCADGLFCYDGLCFDAWMIKPPLFDETKKYPVLVYVCKLRQS